MIFNPPVTLDQLAENTRFLRSYMRWRRYITMRLASRTAPKNKSFHEELKPRKTRVVWNSSNTTTPRIAPSTVPSPRSEERRVGKEWPTRREPTDDEQTET